MSLQMIRIWQEEVPYSALSYFKKLRYVKCEDITSCIFKN